MKNTFKYIVAVLAFSFTVLMPGINASAQNLPEGTYLTKNGLAYAKSATLQADGTYLLDLEAFVTGTVTHTTQTPPVDIVLVLDYSGSMSGSKIRDLRTAVAGFVKTIQDYNKKVVKDALDVGHRIAFVLFDESVYTNSSYLNTLLDVDSLVPGTNTVTVKNTTTNLIGYNIGSGTDSAEGMQKAGTILSGAFDDGDYSSTVTIAGNDYHRSRVVVMFTDGEPYSNMQDALGNINKNQVRSMNLCIDFANAIKTSEYTAPIYTVGLFTSRTADTQDAVTTYMRYTSSAATNGEKVNQTNTGTDPKAAPPYVKVDGTYSIIVSDSGSLSKIFNDIANAAGTSDAQISEESTVTTDVVSNSFSVPDLPEGVSASSVVSVLVAPCEGETEIDGIKYLTFGTEKAPTEYGLPAITPDINEEANSVSTTGFDFSKNYCWYDDVKKEGHGYKQIIRFKITVNDDAVGGPDVATNTSDSGIYVNGEPYARFNIPSVKIPVSLWIKKKGLDPDDSAVFTIGYAPYVAGTDPSTLEYKQFTKVMINKDTPRDPEDNCPVVKLVGLDPDYFYRIKEDAWAWSYSYQSGGVQYTVGEGGSNPFIFVNVPKETVKEAEATVRNVFEKRTTDIVTTPTE